MGLGWAAGDDFCFGNYDVQSDRKDTAWSMNELAATVPVNALKVRVRACQNSCGHHAPVT